MIKINKTPQTLKVPLADVATSLQSVYQLPHSLVPHLVHDECYQCSWASIHPPRPDLLELATSFRGEHNSWGQMRLMERWIHKQPWRKALPMTFPSPSCMWV